MINILIYLYYFIAVYFFVSFALGNSTIEIRKDNEVVELNKYVYFLLCFICSIGWIAMLILVKDFE